jgi:uncharacterized protein
MNHEVRRMPFELLSARKAEDGDGLTIAGYASTFSDPYAINDWRGSYDEQILRGAFRETLGKRKPKMMYNHGAGGPMEGLPVGQWTRIREDKKGLYLEGKLFEAPETTLLRAAVEAGEVDSMSIMFTVADGGEEWVQAGDGTLTRTITNVDALYEAGPVLFPANPSATFGARATEIAQRIAADLAVAGEVRSEVLRILTTSTLDTTVPVPVEDDADNPVPADAASEQDDERSNVNEVLEALRRHLSRRDAA